MRDKLFTRNFTFLILGQVSSLIGNYTLKFALSMYVRRPFLRHCWQ